MRKTYMMLFALVLIALGATKANAGEIISLQEVPFSTWDGWGVLSSSSHGRASTHPPLTSSPSISPVSATGITSDGD